jgi:hypothetical protein
MKPAMWPFFTYLGGKWRAAPLYPSPTHSTIIEPFAGSAGYALRHYEHDVVLYDADPLIAALWRYLISVSAEEILRLPLVVEHVDEVPGPEEGRWLVGFWLNKGMTGPCKTPSKWMRDGWRPKSMWGPEIRDRIASQVEMIRHWKAFHVDDYSSIETPPATWFVDPPYNDRVGKRYRAKVANFDHLSSWCRDLEGQVIVCERHGANWLPFEPLAHIKTRAADLGAERYGEVVWLNDQGVSTSESVSVR